MSGPDVLLTGATGLLGAELLPRLLAVRPGARVHCLLRAVDETELERRLAALRARIEPSTDAGRVVALRGTIEEPGRLELPGGVGAVFHLAASTRFDLELDEARRINVVGATRLVAAARRAGAAFHHVSTAFVAGEPGTGAFRNTYEQSKAEAEEVVRAAAGDIPVTCYRPSIVIGDSRSGRTPHFRVLYEPMKWVYLGKTDVLPCRSEVRLDVVPVDWVCDAIVALSEREAARGQTLPLSAGAERAISIGEIVRISVETANRYHAEIGEPPIPSPRIVTPDSGTPETARLLAAAEAVMSTHLPYMLQEQLFDPAATYALLGPGGPDCPPLGDYLARIVRYGLERRFGSV